MISQTILRFLNESKVASETDKNEKDIFITSVNSKLGPTFYDIGTTFDSGYFFNDFGSPAFTHYINHEGTQESIMYEADEIEDIDQLIESKVLLPKNGVGINSTKVVSQMKDNDWKVKETHNKNPSISIQIYDMMFPDGTTCEYDANEHTYLRFID